MTVTDRPAPSVAPLPTLRHRHTDDPAAVPAPKRSPAGPFGSALSPVPSAANPQRSKMRQNIVVLVTASAMGLWLGIAAPSVSPAAPPAPAATSVAAASAVGTPLLPDLSGPDGPQARRR